MKSRTVSYEVPDEWLEHHFRELDDEGLKVWRLSMIEAVRTAKDPWAAKLYGEALAECEAEERRRAGTRRDLLAVPGTVVATSNDDPRKMVIVGPDPLNSFYVVAIDPLHGDTMSFDPDELTLLHQPKEDEE